MLITIITWLNHWTLSFLQIIAPLNLQSNVSFLIDPVLYELSVFI